MWGVVLPCLRSSSFFFLLLEELYGARYQIVSFSLVMWGVVLHCLRSFPFSGQGVLWRGWGGGGGRKDT